MMDKLWLDYGYWLMDTDWLMNMLLMDVNGCWWVMMVYEWMMVKWWKLWMLMVNEHGVDGWWWVNDSWWGWWITVVNCELYLSCYFSRNFRMMFFMAYICSRHVACFVGAFWRSKFDFVQWNIHEHHQLLSGRITVYNFGICIAR